MSRPFTIELPITVLNGTGEASFGVMEPQPADNQSAEIYGHAQLVIVDAPSVPALSPLPTYEWVLLKVNNRMAGGSNGTLEGDTTSIENIPIVLGGKFRLLKATDGDYVVDLTIADAPRPY